VKPVVLDASAAAPWFIPEERSLGSERLYADVISSAGLFRVPALWLWEVGNILLMALRRRRLGQAAVEAGLALIDACPLDVEPPPNAHHRAQIMRLAQTHQLSFYDASYLELALRLNGRDAALVKAAKQCGLSCIDF